MRRKAVKAVVMHTKDSIQHLKDDDDEMLRGELSELIALHATSLSGKLLLSALQSCFVLVTLWSINC